MYCGGPLDCSTTIPLPGLDDTHCTFTVVVTLLPPSVAPVLARALGLFPLSFLNETGCYAIGSYDQLPLELGERCIHALHILNARKPLFVAIGKIHFHDANKYVVDDD